VKRDDIHDQLYTLIDRRVDFWLSNWARWMRIKGLSRLGYPGRSEPFIGGGESQRTDDWELDMQDEIWLNNCRAMDALIDGLPPSQGCAIHHVYLGASWRFPRGNVVQLVQDAAKALEIGMNDRSIL